MRTTPQSRKVAGWTLAASAAFGIGWLVGGHGVQAGPPAPAPAPAQAEPSDYDKRVVAYIFGTVPITREDLGEYLIARYGVEKLDLLINKKIIDHVCAEKGITVSAAEIEADFNFMVHSIGVSRKDFIEKVLKQYRKSEYEWKEDVIRPRLMLTKFCKDRIDVTEEDLAKAFEAQYGEKVDVQIILYPANQEKYLAQIYDKVRQGEDAFNEEARKQPDSNLAMTAGRIKPVGRNSGMEDIEKIAFSLKPGQISHYIQVKEGWLIMRCVGRLPADPVAKLADKREELRRAVMEMKIAVEIPKVFKELAEQAAPKRHLGPERASRAEQESNIQQMAYPTPKPR